MWKFQKTRDEMFLKVKKLRPIVQPNEGSNLNICLIITCFQRVLEVTRGI